MPGLARRAAIILLLVLVGHGGLLGCRSRPPAEQAIRAQILAMQQALGEGRATDFMAALAEDFAGPEADFDRRRAALLLRAYLQRYRGIRADLGPIDIALHGERATARFLAVLRAGEGVLPEEMGAWRVETGWRREGREWTLIAARWEPAIGR